MLCFLGLQFVAGNMEKHAHSIPKAMCHHDASSDAYARVQVEMWMLSCMMNTNMTVKMSNPLHQTVTEAKGTT